MATEVDLQRLVVSLEASFVKYERAWQRAQGVTDANAKRLGDRFDNVTARINNAGASTANALAPIGLQTGNIAAQFQDIAVQLQSGQSPFTIALQQGTQLTAALGSQAGVRGALSALGAGFLSLVNPISLATIAAITLGGTAVQWLTQMGDGAEEVSDKLKAHREFLTQVVGGYEEAEKAVEAYRAEAEKLPEAEAAGDILREREQNVAAMEAALGRLRDQVGQTINRIDDMLFVSFFTEEQRAQAEAQRAALEAIDAAASEANPDLNAIVQAIRDLAAAHPDSEFLSLAQSIEDAAKEARTFQKEIGAADAALRALPEVVRVRMELDANFATALEKLRDLAPELRSAAEVARASAREALNEALGSAGGDIERQAALREYQTTIAAINEEERIREERSNRGGANKAERERQAVRDLIADLQFEAELIGKTALEQEKMNAVRRAGAAATAEQRAEIEALVAANFAEREAIDRAEEAMRRFHDTAKSALSSFISDLRNGKSATEALGNALNSVADRLLDLALNAALGAIFPGGNLVGGLFGGLFGGFRAAGGPVMPGRAYVVGERGPEMFVPRTPGTVLPNGAMGGRIEVVVSLQDEMLNVRIDNRAAGVAASVTRGALTEYDRNLPGRQLENGARFA
jgi:hypothetical protein